MTLAPEPAVKSTRKGSLLFFSPSLRSGGMERRIVELLFFLKENSDYEPHLVLTEDEIHYAYVEQLGVPITILKRFGLRKDPTLFWRFWCEVKRLRPSLIHSWDRMTTFYAIPAARLLNVPLVNSQITDARPRNALLSFDNVLWGINRRFSSRLVANSFAGLRAYGVKSGDGLVIHNGVRLDRFLLTESRSKIKARYGIKTPYVIMMVASFTSKKDHAKFISLARKIAAIRRDVAFVAIGDGPTREVIMRDVGERGPENVIFTGQIKDIEALVSVCDIGVLLTDSRVHGEGIPNAVLEYMALRKPVIATDAGGTNELVIDGKTGYLLDAANDIDEIVSRTLQLLSSTSLRQELGELGFQRVCAEFSVGRMGSDFLKLYDELVR